MIFTPGEINKKILKKQLPNIYDIKKLKMLEPSKLFKKAKITKTSAEKILFNSS